MQNTLSIEKVSLCNFLNPIPSGKHCGGSSITHISFFHQVKGSQSESMGRWIKLPTVHSVEENVSETEV